MLKVLEAVARVCSAEGCSKKETSAQVSSCEIHEAFQNSIVIEHLRNSVSDVSTILATNLNTFPTTNPFVPSAPFSTP